MQQQLPRAAWFVILAVALVVRTDVGAVEEDFAIPDPGIAVLEVHVAQARALDLGPGQDDSRLEPLQQVKLVGGCPVGRQNSLSVLRLLGHHGLPEHPRKRRSIARIRQTS